MQKSLYIKKSIHKYGESKINKVFWYARLEHPISQEKMTKMDIANLSNISYRVVKKLLDSIEL